MEKFDTKAIFFCWFINTAWKHIPVQVLTTYENNPANSWPSPPPNLTRQLSCTYISVGAKSSSSESVLQVCHVVLHFIVEIFISVINDLYLFFFRMSLSKIDYEFVNNLFCVEGVKFHRGRFDKETFEQQWYCSYCKKQCPFQATSKLGIMNIYLLFK